jgi:hypothetical protein
MALTDHPGRVSAAPDLRRAGLLAAGDLVAFLVFAGIGRASHGEATGLDAILQVVETAAPFAVGWLLVAPFAGAFRAEVIRRPQSMLARTALAWLVAEPIGVVLWSLLRERPIQATFVIITFLTNLVILLGWRGAFAWLAAKKGN